jgi:hypothetical protein
MKETTNTTVTFPSEDEDMGEVAINWFGPPVTVSQFTMRFKQYLFQVNYRTPS